LLIPIISLLTKALEPIKDFSGGEKARVALALIVWQKPNLLLLDEPTNHLDLEMRHALTMALQGYEGALVVISHDRHLLRNTVDEFYLVANGSVDEFNGDLKDYQQWLKNYNRVPDDLDTLDPAQPTAEEAPNQTAEVKGSVGSADKKLQRQQTAEARKKLAPLTKKSKKLEQEIEKLQKEQTVNEALLADVEIYTESKKLQLKEQMEIQVRIKKSIAEKEEIWFEIQQEIEQFS